MPARARTPGAGPAGATTDDIQVRAVLGPGRDGEGRFEDAARFLDQLFLHGLSPKKK